MTISGNISSPLYKSHDMINKDLVFIRRKKRELSLINFVHDDLSRVYGVENVHNLGTDTDSVHVQITGT